MKDISFELRTGDVLGLFGKNGSGKSTLLKMIYGSVSADSIQIKVDGRSYKSSEVITKKLIAYLPQDSFLPKSKRIRDIIPIYFSEEKKQDTLFYDPIIAKFTFKKAGELSLGETRYFEIMLLANLEHPFLFLDEPFSMLDPLYKEILRDVFEKLKSGKGLLITDHYYEDVLKISSKNMLLKNGNCHQVSNKLDLENLSYISKNNQ